MNKPIVKYTPNNYALSLGNSKEQGPIGVLLVEDSFLDQELFRFQFNQFKDKDKFKLHVVDSLQSAIKKLSNQEIELVILDLNLMDSHGVETLKILKEQFTGLAFIVLTGIDDEELALEALKCGAQDYVVKGQFEASLLIRAMTYAVERKRSMKAFFALS